MAALRAQSNLSRQRRPGVRRTVSFVGIAAAGLVVAGCAMIFDPTASPGAPKPEASPDASAAVAVPGAPSDSPASTPDSAPAANSDSSFGEVPLPPGVSLWISDTDILFAVERTGDDVITARAGMGNPRCFFGTVTDGALQGRYRAITAGEGLDRQAEPIRVSQSAGVLTFTERGTGTILGQYSPIDPSAQDSIATASEALAACREMRSAPATATPR